MATLNHVHTYRRLKPGTYMCADPFCTYKVPKKELHEKVALCNSCHTEFFLDRHALRVALPKCIKCRDTKEAQQHKIVAATLEDLFPPESQL